MKKLTLFVPLALAAVLLFSSAVYACDCPNPEPEPESNPTNQETGQSSNEPGDNSCSHEVRKKYFECLKDERPQGQIFTPHDDR